MTFPIPDCAALPRHVPVCISTFLSELSSIPSPPLPPTAHSQPCSCATAPSQKNPAAVSLLSPRLAALERLTSVADADNDPDDDSALPSSPRPAPTSAASLLAALDRPSPPAKPRGDATSTTDIAHPAARLQHAEVHLGIYDADAPTLCARLVASADATLSALIDLLPCGRDTPSSRGAGLLCVNGTLYFDDRVSNCADYALPVASFLRRHGEEASVVRLRDADVRVRDLAPVLGRADVYVHDGDCEHVIIFVDVRAAPAGSPRTDPVRLVWRRRPRVRPCDVCCAAAAVKFVIADPLADRSPFSYCEQCFRIGHFDGEGRAFEKSAMMQVFNHPPPLG